MPDETPAARYQRLARESLETANTFPRGQQRDALIQMAQVWQRLADQHEGSTMTLSPPSGAGARSTMQQQQQVQPKGETED